MGMWPRHLMGGSVGHWLAHAFPFAATVVAPHAARVLTPTFGRIKAESMMSCLARNLPTLGVAWYSLGFSLVFGAEGVELSSWKPIDSTFQAVAGALRLPREGTWQIAEIRGGQAREFYLTPAGEMPLQPLGKRITRIRIASDLDDGKWPLRRAYYAAADYARQHQGKGPPNVEIFLDDEDYQHVPADWNSPDLPDEALGRRGQADTDSPFYFLVPDKEFKYRTVSEADEPQFHVADEDREILAIELRPLLNDGQHWVLYTDGSLQRQPPDLQLLQEYELELRPLLDQTLDELVGAEQADYEAVLVIEGEVPAELQLRLINPITQADHTEVWKTADARQDELAWKRLVRARRNDWRPYLATPGGAVLSRWSHAAPSSGQPDRRPSTFSILGGRAAVEETLQLQVLSVDDNGAQEATIDIGMLQGVEVTSHPFEEMLAGNPGGENALANVIPHDRFFVYVAKPQAVVPLLGRGGDFIADAGAAITGQRLDYHLADMYLSRLGISEQLLRAVLEADLLRDFALSTPDLLFIDGTDITVAARLKHPQLLAGLVGLTGKQIVERQTPAGTSFWSLNDELLLISTNRAELEASLSLVRRDGQGSLGRSSEFRFMLTKLPINEQVRSYGYFSDPFVRRLVGPEVKLGQLRRLIAKGKLEYLTAARLQAQLDGRNASTVADLVNYGYVRESLLEADFSLSEGVARSATWGSLGDLRTLAEVPVTRVSEAEREAYQQYVNAYSRYWRQFFDPIALRLSDQPDGDIELTTYILPLVDNTIYRGLREILVHGEELTELSIPEMTPPPILSFSINVREARWLDFAEGMYEFFTEYSSVSPALLDDLGPSVHLAVHDADPVLALGSGDLLGAFGSGMATGGDEAALVVAPIALSVLTRPCTLMIETRHPQRTKAYLRQSAKGSVADSRGDRWFRSYFHQVEDRDEWIWLMDLAGVVKIRYGIQVSGDYLVLRNIPWSQREEVSRSSPAKLNGAQLTIHPELCELQLPSLFTAAADNERRATLAGLSRLMPILLTHSQLTIEQALAMHDELFAFAPRIAANDRWTWDGRDLSSAQYGSPRVPKQPDFEPGQPFGLLQAIQSATLNMQFEEDGLRSRVEWRPHVRP